MIHQMGLYGIYFEDIKSGKKKMEIRLNDEKRRKVELGDIIEFVDVTSNEETLQVHVIELKRYPTFRQLYEAISFEEMGCEGWTMEQMVTGTYEIYSPEDEKTWGALAIGIQIK